MQRAQLSLIFLKPHLSPSYPRGNKIKLASGAELQIRSTGGIIGYMLRILKIKKGFTHFKILDWLLT